MGAEPKSNLEWQEWGRRDPLWGVASWADRDAAGSNPWTDEDFYAMGRDEWSDFRRQWASYTDLHGICVEIGAGAGRLTLPMTETFEHVHGVDVSDGMIEYAERALAGRPATFHLTDGHSLPFETSSIDAVFSTHVFQHLESDADATRNWREMARVLKSGGTFLVHLPVHFWPGGMESMQRLYLARRRVGDVRAAARRRRMVEGKGAPIMRGRWVSWADLEPELQNLGFGSLELRYFRTTKTASLHPIVLGTREA